MTTDNTYPSSMNRQARIPLPAALIGASVYVFAVSIPLVPLVGIGIATATLQVLALLRKPWAARFNGTVFYAISLITVLGTILGLAQGRLYVIHILMLVLLIPNILVGRLLRGWANIIVAEIKKAEDDAKRIEVEVREWTSTKSDHTFPAQYLYANSEFVLLRREDGKTVKMARSTMAEADRQYLDTLRNPDGTLPQAREASTTKRPDDSTHALSSASVNSLPTSSADPALVEEVRRLLQGNTVESLIAATKLWHDRTQQSLRASKKAVEGIQEQMMREPSVPAEGVAGAQTNRGASATAGNQPAQVERIKELRALIWNQVEPTRIAETDIEAITRLGAEAVPVIITIFKDPKDPRTGIACNQAILAYALSVAAGNGDTVAAAFLRQIADDRIPVYDAYGQSAYNIAKKFASEHPEPTKTSTPSCATCGRVDAELNPCMKCHRLFCSEHGTRFAGMFACPECLREARQGWMSEVNR